jgi:periplasmic divalent cation tolerance protein
MGFIVVYITHRNRREARKVVNYLLERRLIACGNIFPIESSYWWNGEIEESGEVVSLVKTKQENWEGLKSEVERIHPYEVPCIMRVPAQANKAYEDWIRSQTQ